MNLTIVLDIDDTISVHVNRDYPNAIPKLDVIKKINYLHDELGYTIKLFTSRGMGSTGNNIELSKQKNEPILLEWLKKYDVHYDELIFGKPLGDLYVDDRCLDVDEFLNEGFGSINNGGSGRKVERLGKLVAKEIESDKMLLYKKWSQKVLDEKLCNTPKIVSSLYNLVYIEYIENKLLSDDCDLFLLKGLNEIVERFSSIKNDVKEFDINKHIKILKKNRDERINDDIDYCISLLKAIDMKKYTSFCHGDLIFSNVLVDRRCSDLYLIDQNWDDEASSYILDYAKMMMSLLGYERYFEISKIDKTEQMYYDDRLLQYQLGYLGRKNILYEVLVFTYMYILRLWRYKKEEDKDKILQLLDKLKFHARMLGMLEF